MCICEEGRAVGGGPLCGKDGRERPGSDHHDCGYVRARNALLSEAEELANESTRRILAHDGRGDTLDTLRGRQIWSREFIATMNMLAARKGIANEIPNHLRG